MLADLSRKIAYPGVGGPSGALRGDPAAPDGRGSAASRGCARSNGFDGKRLIRRIKNWRDRRAARLDLNNAALGGDHHGLGPIADVKPP